MSDLRELYQEYILDHGKNPRNFRVVDEATHAADGYNPLCGDKLRLELRLDGETIADLGFTGNGCAIHTASASTMTEVLMGKTVPEAREHFAQFIRLVRGEDVVDAETPDTLAVFGGVSEFPMRVKCATLSWHTLSAALDGEKVASTE